MAAAPSLHMFNTRPSSRPSLLTHTTTTTTTTTASLPPRAIPNDIYTSPLLANAPSFPDRDSYDPFFQ